MIGTLRNGIAGLETQQKAIDNEAHNVANVSTVGYKSSRVSFADKIYQDDIGMGSKVLSVDKQFIQGNLKPTNSSYDVALNGSGFFAVKSSDSFSNSEEKYTRSGNFHMAENGTLQTADGLEVQGWYLDNIDLKTDIVSTDQNDELFTNKYSKLLANKIINHNTYVETVTLKATDYSETTKSDDFSVFSGAGAKNKSTKLQDVELAVQEYENRLSNYKQNPTQESISSSAQISHINFPTGNSSLLSSKGSFLNVYIDGMKITQEYVATSATKEFMEKLYLQDPSLGDPNGTLSISEKGKYNRLASRVETYKSLTDKISNIPGLVAYTVKDTNNSDMLSQDNLYEFSADSFDISQGIIEIRSLIPGKEFKITEVSEILNNSLTQGDFQTIVTNTNGSGLEALNSARDALSKIISGEKQDVYTLSDLKSSSSPSFSYSINVYDKELKTTIPVPNDGAVPLKAQPLSIDALDENGNISIDEFINQFNTLAEESNPKVTDYVEALNLNGNLVIKTLDHNFDVKFEGVLEQTASFDMDINKIVDNATYNFELVVNGKTHPISVDYSGENDMESFENYPDSYYEDIKLQVELQVSSLNDTNPSYELALTELVGDKFTIYTKNKEINLNNSSVTIVDNIPTVDTIKKETIKKDYEYAIDQLKFKEPTATGELYSLKLMGETFEYTSKDGDSSDEIAKAFKEKIDVNEKIKDLLDVTEYFDTIGDATDGLFLENGLKKQPQSFVSSTDGVVTIKDGLKAGMKNLTLYLNEVNQDDTIQVFTKSGKHIAGTPAGDESWEYKVESPIGSGNYVSNGSKNPADILKLKDENGKSYFNDGAVYENQLDNPSIPNSYYGPYSSESKNTNDDPLKVQDAVEYINKYGVTESKNLYEFEEMVVIPEVTEELIVFVNGVGSSKMTAEWESGSIGVNSDPLTISQLGFLDENLPLDNSINELSTNITLSNLKELKDVSIEEQRFKIDISDENSSSNLSININEFSFDIQTDQTPTIDEVVENLKSQINNSSLYGKFSVSSDGDDIVIQNLNGDYGYGEFTKDSSINIESLTKENDNYETIFSKVNALTFLKKDQEFSNSKGAGAELLEMKTKVDQTLTKDSIQLKLDTLGISDNPSGDISIDGSGLITMTQDGASYAIGQVAIANFTNETMLEPIGDNNFKANNNTGDPIYNINNTNSAQVVEKTLEVSTANLSNSLVSLMTHQRAFEANSKSITTSAEILTTLIQLKK